MLCERSGSFGRICLGTANQVHHSDTFVFAMSKSPVRFGVAMVMMRWIAILLLAFPAIGLAETEPEFYLCSPYVEKSTVGEQTDLGWPVYVNLTEFGTTNLEAFTEANTGKMIRILVGSREFSKATIWVPIPSGNLRGTFSSQEVATDWQRILTGKLPAAPCGARN